MIQKISKRDEEKLYKDVIREIFDQLVIVPTMRDYRKAEEEGKVPYYEYYDELYRSVKLFFLSNYSFKPIELRMFRETSGRPDLTFTQTATIYKNRGGCVFIGWSKERYLQEYPKALELKFDNLHETQFGLVRTRCSDKENFPVRERVATEKWQRQFLKEGLKSYDLIDIQE